jgi:hypothetical protein
VPQTEPPIPLIVTVKMVIMMMVLILFVLNVLINAFHAEEILIIVSLAKEIDYPPIVIVLYITMTMGYQYNVQNVKIIAALAQVEAVSPASMTEFPLQIVFVPMDILNHMMIFVHNALKNVNYVQNLNNYVKPVQKLELIHLFVNVHQDILKILMKIAKHVMKHVLIAI